MSFDFDLIVRSLPILLEGALITIQITVLSVGIGALIGLVVSLFRIAGPTPLRFLAKAYVDFLRGTPLLVQIFMIYFALPSLIRSFSPDFRMEPIIAAVAACSLNSGAYIAEIFRSGIEGVDKGQMEAGRSLGLSWPQTMRFIILPQAFRRIVPLLGNELIAMLKDSSLVSVIGFEELTRRGQLIISRTYASLEIWFTVAILYLILTFAISRLVAYVERRFEIKCEN